MGSRTAEMVKVGTYSDRRPFPRQIGPRQPKEHLILDSIGQSGSEFR